MSTDSVSLQVRNTRQLMLNHYSVLTCAYSPKIDSKRLGCRLQPGLRRNGDMLHLIGRLATELTADAYSI